MLLRAPSSQPPHGTAILPDRVRSFSTSLQLPSVNAVPEHPATTMDFGDESKREWDSRLWVSNQKGNGSNHASLWTTTMCRLGCRIRYIQVQHSETALVIMASAAVKHTKIPAASSCFINYALQNIRSGYNHTLFFSPTWFLRLLPRRTKALQLFGTGISPLSVCSPAHLQSCQQTKFPNSPVTTS